jgi:hypothetical protein
MSQRLPGLPGHLRNIGGEKRKVGILLILVMLMFALWGRTMIGGPAGVSPASASQTMVTVQDLPTMIGSRNGSHDMAVLLQEWTRQPLAPVGRNLFEVKLDYFARDPSKAAITAQQVRAETFWDQLAKSINAQADQRKERQILVENLQRQASQLRIQTILMGENPRALINGELVGEGDVAASFRVLRIEARRIVVEREGVRMEIVMN